MEKLKYNFKINRLFVMVLIGLASVSLNAKHEHISVIKTKKRTQIDVPTLNGKSPSVVVKSDNGSLVFAAGEAAQTIAEAEQTSTRSKELNFESLNPLQLKQLQLLKWKENQHTVAAIYPIRMTDGLRVTALHALQDTSSSSSDSSEKWYGFIDPETNEVLDVAIIAKKEELLQSLLQYSQGVQIGQNLLIYHLNLIDGADDPTLAVSLAKTRAVSEKFFYFLNSKSSTVGPQSSGAVIYDLADGIPLGIVSCLSEVNTTGPAQHLIKAISFSYLQKAIAFELTHETISNYKNNCQTYDGKKGGGD